MVFLLFCITLSGDASEVARSAAQRHTGKLGETFRGNRFFLLTREAHADGTRQHRTCTKGFCKRGDRPAHIFEKRAEEKPAWWAEAPFLEGEVQRQGLQNPPKASHAPKRRTGDGESERRFAY